MSLSIKHPGCGHDAQLFQHGWLGLLPCATCWDDGPVICCSVTVKGEDVVVAKYRRRKGSSTNGWLKSWTLTETNVIPEARA